MTELKKVLSLRTVVSSSAGMALATASYLAGFQVAIMTVGELAWVSILVAGILCLLSAMCFSEMVSLYPTAAGIKLYIQHAFNEKAAIAVGMFYVITGISIVGAESYLLTSVLLETVGVMFSPTVDRFCWMFFFVVLVGYVNYRGVQLTGLTQDIMAYVMFGFLIVASVYALATKGVDVWGAFSDSRFTLTGVLQASGLGVVLYMGYEWVTPLAEETEDYRMVGKGMMLAIGLLSITYALFVVAMYTGLTDEQLKSGTTIPHILFGKNLFGNTGRALFIVMSLLASLTSFNAGMLNFSRFAYAMGRVSILPRALSRLHPDYATPWVAILALMGFAVVLSTITILSGQYLFILTMAAATECFIYVVVAICVIMLRKKKPDQERAFKVPFGLVIPVFTALVFTGLMAGIFMDNTRDINGAILFHNYWVALVMAVMACIMVAYTLFVVPRLKQAAQERTSARKRRRPGKS